MSAEDSNTSANDAAASNTGTAVEGGSSTAPDLASESPAVAPSPSPDDGSVVSPLKSLRPSRPRPSLMISASAAQSERENVSKNVPHSARQAGDASKSVHTHASLSATAPVLHRSASGTVLAAKEATGAESNEKVETPQSARLPSAQSARTPGRTSIIVSPGPARTQHQIALNESIRAARQLSHNMKSKVAAEREALMKKEEAEAAKLAQQREEESNNKRLEYDWRSLLSKHPDDRDEEEVLYLLHWVISLRIEFLLNLPREILMTLCKHFQLEQFQPDTYVFEQGDEGQKFYVILKGSVGVHIKEDEEDAEEHRKEAERKAKEAAAAAEAEALNPTTRKRGKTHGSVSVNNPLPLHVEKPKPGAPKEGFVEVMTMHVGGAFGEVALISSNEKRSASIKTKEESMFLTIDKATYALALKDKANQERNRRETFVRNHIFFRRLVNEKQNSLISSLKEKIYSRNSVIVREGEEIVREGESSSQIFFVAQGCVLIKKMIRPHVMAINVLAKQNQQYKVSDMHSASATQDDAFKNTISMPSIPPTTIRGHLNTTAAAGGGSGDNNATGAGASNAEGELHHHAAAINRAGSVGATRRALGAASKTDAGAHIPFSTATHGYGASGGSNLETFSQVVELGRIGPGSFFAEEGILDLQSEFRDYSVVADEVKVVVYALDRVAFHKSIKGNVLGMLQEMALKKKELRQKRIEALIRSYISASEQGAMLGSNAMGAPMYSPRNNGKQRLTRPQPPALPPSNANGAAANSTSSASSTTLSIFHVPNRTKPVNIRSFGIVRHAGAVPQILNDDDSDQFHSGPSAMEDEEDYWSEEEKQTHQEQARATTPIARRGHRGSAPWEDVELTLATVEHAATATATGSKDASNRSIAHSRRSSRGSMVSLLESAQTRSIPPATAAAAAVARRNRSRSRSRSRSKSAHRRPHPPTSTSATDRSSRPSSRGGNNEEYENVSEANPPLAPAVISVVPAPSSATSAPPPLVTSAVMHQLLGTKSAVTPLALLTQSSIPLSALSALSPHPLPPLMPINVKEELEKKLREEELARAAKLMQKKQKAEIRSRSRQNSIVDSRTNLLEQKLQEALVMNEIREEETQHLGTLNHPASSSAPVSPKDQLSDSDSGSDSDSDSDSDDDSDDSDDDLIEREIGDSPADLPTSVSPTKLEKLRAELEAREAWKTSPRRLSVLSRLIGIGTGHGTQRVVDQETGTIVSDISQHAKQIEAVVGHGKQQELKRRHIMAHLQRSEPNTARTFSKDSSTASSRQSSRPVSPHKSAGLNGTMTMGLQQVAETPQKDHEEEEKRDGNETPATGEKSKPATLKSPRGIHSITSSDPLLRGPSFTSRSFAPCLYGSAGHGTTSSPASLSPFVHATGAAIQAMQYSRKASLSHDEKAGVVPSPQSAPAVPGTPSSLTAPVLLEDARKHRFVPIASSPRNRSWDPSLTPRNSELAAATSTSFPTITSPRTPYVIVRKRNPPTPGGGSNFFASASGSSAISTRRPYHSISRAGLVSFGLGKVNLEEAAAELAQNQANGGMDAAAPFFHYTHTSTASVSLSAPSPRLLSGASGNLGSNIAAAAAAASPSHTAVSPASIPVSPFSPSSSLSGPSLLPASSVAAIERYLHHQLQLEHESFGLASDSARRKRKKGNTLNRGFPPTELNIHKLEELATRSHRRAQFDGVAVASRSTVSTTTEDSPAPPQAAAPVAPGTPSQLPSRRITPFAVSALLNGETSVAVPPRIPKSYRPVPIYHHLKNQLLDRI